MKLERRVASVAALGLGAAMLASPRVGRAQDELSPLQGRTRKVAAEAGAAVVGLGRHKSARPSSVSEMLDSQAGGAGFIIDEQGDILTEASLVPPSGDVTVTLRGGARVKARAVASDPHTHVALLRLTDVNAAARHLGGRLPVLPLGTSADLQLGRVVATLGNPFDSLRTDGVPAFSLGVVSSLGRVRDADAWKGYAIETDAAVNPGSFGGPLIDVRGRAVGIVVEAISPKRWLGVAVPIDEVVRVLADLKGGRSPHGPRLGIAVSAGGEASRDGVTIDQVAAQGPAALAGLKAGDRLVALDGKRIAESADLERELAELAQGAPVRLDVARDGKTVELTATLDASPDEPVVAAIPTTQERDERPTDETARKPERARADGKPWLGLNVEERDGGLVISEVVSGGPAERLGLKVGDRVLAFAGKPVQTRADMVELLSALSPGETVKLRMERDGWAKNVDLVLGTKAVPGTKGAARPEGDREDDGDREDKGRGRRGKKAKDKAPAAGARRGFLGVGVQPVEGEDGLAVTVVAPGSPAEKAKIQKGDLILAVDGKKVEDPEAFTSVMKGHQPGDKVTLTLSREGWERKLDVTLAERPAELDRPQQPHERDEKSDDEEKDHEDKAPRSTERAPASKGWLGIAVIERDGALVVDDLAEGSPAAASKLKKGDVLSFEGEDGNVWRPASADQLAKFLGKKSVGDKVTVVVTREDGWVKKIPLTLAERPSDK